MSTTAVWIEPLRELCERIRRAAREAIAEGLARGSLEELGRPVRAGAGDLTYGLDERTELALDRWFEERARQGPLSLLTEDRGWRHRGPDGRGGARELAGFDHGGPRIAVDPVDGTRNLMADLRAAWVIVSFAPPGKSEPRMRDLTLGIASELPDSRAARFRELVGVVERGAQPSGGVCTARELELASGRVVAERVLRANDTAHVDHGYFTFFRYLADQRPAIARIEAEFFARLAREEGADVRTCYDDQYISSGGQLSLVALGVYRMAVDVRGLVAAKRGVPTITTKPYDLAGAVVCARAAGALVTRPDGGELDFAIDCTTPVDFAAFANRATFERVGRHLRAALGTLDA
jgi:fructose-1,6-bisphosphatase/inositol monophosphatase family enzyme